MTELLSPAGNMDCLKKAIAGGADAVYVGGKQFGARAFAQNFTAEEMLSAIRLCHVYHKKLYLTVNTLIREQELSMLPVFLRPFYEEGLDGVIAADLGVISCIHDLFPDLPIHASTQMTLTGPLSSELLKKLGVVRIVPARELSVKEIKRLKDETGMEIEVFIHGAMCYAYSGQCLMSSMLGERSGNRGRCGGPCRLPYKTICGGKELNADNEPFQLCMKDMCSLDTIFRLLDMDIESFKIEGRMKSPEYVYFVTDLYRRYIDSYLENGKTEISKEDMESLTRRFNRGGSTNGYLDRHNGRSMIMLYRSGYSGSTKNGQKGSGDGLYEGDKTGSGGRGVINTDNAEGDDLQKVSVSGELYVQETRPLKLKLKTDRPGSFFEAELTGPVAEPAKKSPLSFDDLKKRISKLGDTCFCLNTLDVYIRNSDDDEYAVADAGSFPELFCSIRDINELRRKTAETLLSKMLETRRRTLSNEAVMKIDAYGSGDRSKKNLPGKKEGRISVSFPGSKKESIKNETGQDNGTGAVISVRSIEQLRAVNIDTCERLKKAAISYDLFRVTGLRKAVEDEIIKLKEKSVQILLRLPQVSRQSVIAEYDNILNENALGLTDGFICSNLESLAYLKKAGYEGRIISDSGLYVFQPETAHILSQWGVDGFIFPCELNAPQMTELIRSFPYEFILPVYGYQPVMVSAQCLRATNNACLMESISTAKRMDEASKQIYLKDRMNKQFPVILHCDRCENTIYNTVPLSLHKDIERAGKTGASLFLLSFTIEKGETVRQITDFYLKDDCKGKIPKALGNFTRGHFIKGVD